MWLRIEFEPPASDAQEGRTSFRSLTRSSAQSSPAPSLRVVWTCGVDCSRGSKSGPAPMMGVQVSPAVLVSLRKSGSINQRGDFEA